MGKEVNSSRNVENADCTGVNWVRRSERDKSTDDNDGTTAVCPSKDENGEATDTDCTISDEDDGECTMWDNGVDKTESDFSKSDKGSKSVGVDDCTARDDESGSKVGRGHEGIDADFPTYDDNWINSEINKVDEGTNSVNTKDPEVCCARKVAEGNMVTDVGCIADDMVVSAESRYCDCIRDDGGMGVYEPTKLGCIKDDGSIDISINDDCFRSVVMDVP